MKKIMAFLLTLCLVGSLMAGCGGNSTENGKNSDTSKSAETSKTNKKKFVLCDKNYNA
ncbi:MAG: hypothetical protein Q4F21_11540 [Lachnospiraceae bacterium]|nr:hypothetical protein [Lachnospiraceae bacterium]